MLRKLLILMLAVLLICPTISVGAQESASVKMYITDDFEKYTYPETSDGTIRINESGASNGGTASGVVKNEDEKAIENIWEFVTYGFKAKAGLETIERKGVPTKAVYLETLGSGNANNNVRFGVKSDMAKSVVTDGYRYAVLKLDIKNGSSESDYVGDIRFFRDSKLKISKSTIGSTQINEYDWNEYIFILDTQSFTVSLAVNGVMTDIIATPTESYFTNLAGLNHSGLSMYSVSSGAKIWFDNASLYGTNSINTVIDSSVPEDGVLNAARSDEIVIKLKGSEVVTELTSGNVTVTKTNDDVTDAAVSVADVTYNKEENTIKITLSEKTDESTYYTVNLPEIKNVFACISPASNITFRTTGPVKLDLATEFKKAATGTAITAIEKGLVEVKAEITNSDVVEMQSGVIIAELKKDGKTMDMAHEEVGALAVSAKHSASFAFTVPDDTYEISVYAKDSLNGAYTFSDVVTLLKSGISANKVSNLEVAPPMLDEAKPQENQVKFYSLTLGEAGVRREITKIESGLIECAANVKVEDLTNPFIIATLKKDGVLIKTAYLTKTGENGANKYSVALFVPEGEGYSIDVFAWTDFDGTGSYFGKTTLA